MRKFLKYKDKYYNRNDESSYYYKRRSRRDRFEINRDTFAYSNNLYDTFDTILTNSMNNLRSNLKNDSVLFKYPFYVVDTIVPITADGQVYIGSDAFDGNENDSNIIINSNDGNADGYKQNGEKFLLIDTYYCLKNK